MPVCFLITETNENNSCKNPLIERDKPHRYVLSHSSNDKLYELFSNESSCKA